MKAKETDLPEKKYFRLQRAERNLYSVEEITVKGDKIIATDSGQPEHLPIAFDKMRRRTADSYFAVVNENK